MTPIQLRPTETVPGRPFTSVELYPEDLRCLRVLIADLRDVLGRTGNGEETIEPYALREWTADGLIHRLIICDEERLRDHEALCAVGFLSERHPEVDIAPLEDANRRVVEEFPDYPGVLSYGSMQLPAGSWANLVLHEEPETAEEWRRSEVHADAVATLAPLHYKNIRIHNARLTSGLSDEPDILIMRTKYFDYANGSDWRAIRELPLDPAG